MTQVIDCQGYHPCNKKLSDLPNKIIIFLPRLLHGWQNFEDALKNVENFKFTKSLRQL